MKNLKFTQARFIKSALQPQDFPPLQKGKCEIAIIGKSNVGKSSLINHLLNYRGLAKVSSTPGKTQMLNFFMIDENMMLVDLPGYGYSRVSKEIKEQWSEWIDHYLKQREDLSGLLQLIDIRRLPSQDDIAFIKWCHHHGKPFLILFTKSDKLNAHEQKRNIEASLQCIRELSGVNPGDHYLACSVKDPLSRQSLIHKINTFLNDLG